MGDNCNDAFDLWYYDKFESCESPDILRGDAALLRSYAKDGWDAAMALKRESGEQLREANALIDAYAELGPTRLFVRYSDYVDRWYGGDADKLTPRQGEIEDNARRG